MVPIGYLYAAIKSLERIEAQAANAKKEHEARIHPLHPLAKEIQFVPEYMKSAEPNEVNHILITIVDGKTVYCKDEVKIRFE